MDSEAQTQVPESTFPTELSPQPILKRILKVSLVMYIMSLNTFNVVSLGDRGNRGSNSKIKMYLVSAYQDNLVTDRTAHSSAVHSALVSDDETCHCVKQERHLARTARQTGDVRWCS